MNDIENRARFEVWATSRGLPVERNRIGGDYLFDETYDAWTAWQASLTPQWLPIESAPADGTRVLLWDTAKGGYAITGAWVVGSADDHETFTHWQPLPAPPEVSP